MSDRLYVLVVELVVGSDLLQLPGGAGNTRRESFRLAVRVTTDRLRFQVVEVVSNRAREVVCLVHQRGLSLDQSRRQRGEGRGLGTQTAQFSASEVEGQWGNHKYINVKSLVVRLIN